MLAQQLRVLNIKTHDIRFPTSIDDVGTDAIHTDCDYSATYIQIFTNNPQLIGIGLTFTIGKGNDLCVACVDHLKPFILNKTIFDLENNMNEIWQQCTSHSQLRWIGPEKGVVHLAVAAVFNGIWDLISKFYGKPLWEYVVDLDPDELLKKVTFMN